MLPAALLIALLPVAISGPLRGEDAPAAIDAATAKRWSAPFRGWHYHPDHVIPAKPAIRGYEEVHMTDVPTVFQRPDDPKWYMIFAGIDGKGYQSFTAESEDLLDWTNVRLAMGYGPEGGFDHGGVVLGAHLYRSHDLTAPRVLKRKDGRFWSLYGAYPRQGGYELRPGSEGVAASRDGLAWRRAKDEPLFGMVPPLRKAPFPEMRPRLEGTWVPPFKLTCSGDLTHHLFVRARAEKLLSGSRKR